MADIIDELSAGHQRILLLQQALWDADHSCGNPRCHRLLASAWNRLAFWIETYTGAEQEICYLSIYGTSPRALQRMRDADADIGDLRFALNEARLHPPGSPAWRRAAHAALSRWRRHLDRGHGVLASYGLRATGSLRAELARQWQAYTSARLADLISPAQQDSHGCDFCQWPLPSSHRHVLDTQRAGIYCSCQVCWDLHQAKMRHKDYPASASQPTVRVPLGAQPPTARPRSS